MKSPIAIDVFSGMGGLTLGLKRAGFHVKAAIEIAKETARTYETNHPEVVLLRKDIRKVTGKEVLRAMGSRHIDLIAGCPPCQGFSALTRKYHHEDPRNDLIFEMLRLIKELNPTIVMMENVPGLAIRGKTRLVKFVRALESLGYVPNYGVLHLANYGIPQSRRRLVLLAGKGFRINFPPETHSRTGDNSDKLKQWPTLKQVIGRTERPVTLSRAFENGGPRKFNWHVVRDLKPLTRKRIKALKAGESRRYLPKDLRPDCHSRSDKGFDNVYGRLDWNRLPPTITRGCTTPCMGRFGHPSQIRTISVREAAMLQTFPASYELTTDFMDVACDMLGNALPPAFAQVVGKACFEAFSERTR